MGRNPLEIRWSFSGAYAARQIAEMVLFREYYWGRFGPPSEALYNAVNQTGVAFGREMERVLADPGPRAFENAFARLRAEIDTARKTADIKPE
jgi:hypothetical protein